YTAKDGLEALEQLRKEAPAAIVMDIKMPRLNGMEALEKIKEIDPQIPVVMITAYGDVQSAVLAMKLGAYDYLTKPFNNEVILFTIKRALERRELMAQVEGLMGQVGNGAILREVMGASPQIQMVFQQVQQVARSNFTVVLQGETGTGKEIVARAIHQQSDRRENPFVALDCGAIPETLIESELFGYEKGAFTGADRRKEGHFELATGGTLFLDEVANLPLATQSKLLRVLQERRVQPLGSKRVINVKARIIVASNVLLEEEARRGKFRQDLYHRLNEFSIHIPPLRERREDIPYLAKRFLDEAKMELKKNVLGLSEEAVKLLLSYPWPGNVRELRNTIRRAVLLSTDVIRPEHLTPLGSETLAIPFEEEVYSGIKTRLSLKEIADKATAEVEKRMIQQVLQATRGNKSQAAKLLRIDYKTLHNKIKRYGIRAREFLP
ncbi:MAG: sigma-54-dependent Fis family transcriptional regulator, partial [candidate division NC10 bacterium]|nr:sigma-54-dependent Fis family transcriptional regulator [candidate division NC10 bacterium]